VSVFDAGTEGGAVEGTTILGNYLGADRSGSLDRGNGGYGILLSHGSGTVAGAPGAPNVISGNGASGVLLSDKAAGNTIRSNLIGLTADGLAALGNDDHGVEALASGENTIGGTAPGSANSIAHNGDAGVMVGGGASPAVAVSVLGNSIFANGGLGIDLRPDLLTGGVTENGACNQLEGGNRCQEFPVLTAAAGPTAAAAGTLASDPGKRYRVEVFANAAADPSGNGEGERFLGAVETTTDGAGNASWLLAAPGVALADGEAVAATATELDPCGAPLSTSELSDDLAAPICDLTGDTLANTLVGGPGDEVICGLGGDDSLTGGAGRDALLAGEGDDTVFADDGQPDAVVDCGPGTDVVHADEEAVDPAAILVGCETVLRPALPPPSPPATSVTQPAPVRKCRGKAATIVGSGKGETIRGTGKADVILALGGNDKVKGRGGNDTICGGDGKDTLEGGDGKDVAEGGDGSDLLRGGRGADTLYGDKGKDTLRGGDGPDRLAGGRSGGDLCDGQRGRDRLKSKPGCERRKSVP
jgi:Ca2+-binding RTX toxin-like protein